MKVFCENSISDFKIYPFLADVESTGITNINTNIQRLNSYQFLKQHWNTLELKGKFNKGINSIVLGFAFSNPGKVYVSDFKFFLYENGTQKEITINNGDFTNQSIEPWLITDLEKGAIIKTIFSKFSDRKALLVDNSKTEELEGGLGFNKKVGKYMNVNGVKLYYEIYGKGQPLLLIHGNNDFMGSFYQQFNALKQKYMVIGLDSRGQGKSTADSTKITYELMAEDVNTFLDSLHLKNVNILGWSDGGNIALPLAMRHPDKVKKMAIMGTVLYNDKTSLRFWVNPLLRMQVRKMKKNNPNVSTQGITKSDMNYRLKMLLLTEPHINPDSLQKIKAPVLVMAGQHDVVREQHTNLIAEKIPHSELLIFKSADHEAPSKIPVVFNKAVIDFFEK